MDEAVFLAVLNAFLKKGLTNCDWRPGEVEFAVGIAAQWPGFVKEEGVWLWKGDGVVPCFLRDFRAAMSLVPDTCEVHIDVDKSEPVCPSVLVHRWDEQPDGMPFGPHRADMDTVEEALAVAALKARKRERLGERGAALQSPAS